jgi:hypothetical protein
MGGGDRSVKEGFGGAEKAYMLRCRVESGRVNNRHEPLLRNLSAVHQARRKAAWYLGMAERVYGKGSVVCPTDGRGLSSERREEETQRRAAYARTPCK